MTCQPRPARCTAQLHQPSQALFAPYRDVRTRGRWDAGRVMLLGDAGHATSPQLGQGADLALLDAWSLARSLDEQREVDLALSRYSARRRAHLRFFAVASRWLTPVYQADHQLLAWPRDRLMAPAARVGWLRRQMLATMAGAKTGPFSTLPVGELPAGRDESAGPRASAGPGKSAGPGESAGPGKSAGPRASARSA